MTTVSEEQRTAFLQIISAEVDAVRSFISLLQGEQTVLSNGKTDDLPELIEKKNQLAIELTTLAGQRNTLLTKHGFATDRAGVEAWCAKHPKEKTISEAWTTILSLAKEARELNRLNGELIQIRMQYNNKALETLLGQNKALDLYGPDGQSTSPGHRRINDAV